MAKLKHPERTLSEVKLVSSHFGPVDFDDTTVVVHKFDLPHTFNRASSKLLIILPSDYPEMPPTDLYVEKRLKRNGQIPGHYFENQYGDRKIRKAGFAWYSIHFNAWNANARSIIRGDNLLTAIDALHDSLKRDDERG